MKDFRMTRVKRKPYHNMQYTHNHDSYEIYYLLSGKRKFFIHDTIYHIEKGNFVLLKSGIVHKTSNIADESHERIDIYFTGEIFRKLFPDNYQKLLTIFDNPYFVPTTGMNEYIEKLLSRLEIEYEVGDELSKTLIEGYLKELIIFIFREKNTEIASSIVSGDSVIEKAAHYIIKNYNKDMTLEKVSEFVHLSPGYFSKKFKAETGMGFKEYLVKIRIQKAAELLYETEDSVTEIAFNCGFNDSNYFGDAFTRIMNISPSRYRKIKRMQS